MGQDITLTAKDGFKLGAYRADPEGKPRGAIVVIQEIFGVNHHIRSVTDRYAALGYVAIAPSVFDRGEKGFDTGYDQDAMAKARAMRGKITTENLMLDTQAAIDAVQGHGKVGIVGYCMGGSVAFLAATRLTGVNAAVGYYGGQIAQSLDEKPKIPLMLHFGDHDPGIPMTDVEKIQAALPNIPIYIYHAGHGFHCDERGSFDAFAAQVAGARTQEFFLKNVG